MSDTANFVGNKLAVFTAFIARLQVQVDQELKEAESTPAVKHYLALVNLQECVQADFKKVISNSLDSQDLDEGLCPKRLSVQLMDDKMIEYDESIHRLTQSNNYAKNDNTSTYVEMYLPIEAVNTSSGGTQQPAATTMDFVNHMGKLSTITAAAIGLAKSEWIRWRHHRLQDLHRAIEANIDLIKDGKLDHDAMVKAMKDCDEELECLTITDLV